MAKEVIKNYSIGIKSKYGGYSSVSKNMTESQFNAYYDEVVKKGGKVIGIITTDI